MIMTSDKSVFIYPRSLEDKEGMFEISDKLSRAIEKGLERNRAIPSLSSIQRRSEQGNSGGGIISKISRQQR